MTGRTPTPVNEGHLTTFWETGPEGMYGAVAVDAPAGRAPATDRGYASLHLLAPGDHLEVLRSDGTVLWAGLIE